MIEKRASEVTGPLTIDTRESDLDIDEKQDSDKKEKL